MKNNSLIVRNSIFLAIRTIVITIVSLYSIRELLLILGIEQYGLFNLIFGVAILFSFVNGAMVSSTQRYLAYYIGKEDEELVNYVWNNSLILHFSIGFFVSFFLIIIKNIILDKFLVIDLKYRNSAIIVYYCSVVVVFISIIQAPFNALILAKEKMSFFAFLSFFDVILKLGIIYILYFIGDSILEKYALMYLGSILVVFLIYYYYCYNVFRKKFQLVNVKPELLKELCIYSLWNIFGNFAFMAKTQGINIVLNVLIGVIANSAYTLTASVSSAVGNLINSVVTAINPQIYKSYAEQDFDRNTLLINTASKFSFFLGLIVVLPILFNTKYVLNLWLHDLPMYLVGFVQIALITLLVECLSGSLMTGIQATAKVKAYQVVVSISVFLNLPLSYLGLKVLGNPMIVYVVSLFMAVISLGLRLYFINRLIKFSALLYLKKVIVRVVLVALSSFVFSLMACEIIKINNDFISFIMISFLIVLIVFFCIFVFGLHSSERQFILSKINGCLK